MMKIELVIFNLTCYKI